MRHHQNADSIITQFLKLCQNGAYVLNIKRGRDLIKQNIRRSERKSADQRDALTLAKGCFIWIAIYKGLHIKAMDNVVQLIEGEAVVSILQGQHDVLSQPEMWPKEKLLEHDCHVRPGVIGILAVFKWKSVSLVIDRYGSAVRGI